MSHSLQPHRLQHTRLLCPPLSPGVSSDLCPSHRWCYITVSSSATPFSLCLRFPSEFALHIRWPKYCSFSFSIGPSNKYLGLISFRIDWFDLLAVQGTLKSILQHWKLKASVLWHSAFLMVQLSHPYMTADYMITWLLDMVFMYFEPFI